MNDPRGAHGMKPWHLGMFLLLVGIKDLAAIGGIVCLWVYIPDHHALKGWCTALLLMVTIDRYPSWIYGEDE